MGKVAHCPPSAAERLETLCYLLVWMGAFGLLLVPEAPPPLILAFCLILAPSRFLSVPAQKSRLYRAMWRISTVLFIVLSLLDWYWKGRSLTQVLVAQMLFFQTYKAYNEKTYSDFLQMALFAILMVVFTALVSTSVFFILILVPFVAVLTAFLLGINLVRFYMLRRRKRIMVGGRCVERPFSYQVTSDAPGQPTWPLPRRSWLIQTVAIFAVCLPLFYLFPRGRVYTPANLTGSPRDAWRDSAISGLSGEIDLKHFDTIKRDPRPVIKVTFPARIPTLDTLYLRSGSLEKLVDDQWCAVRSYPRIEPPDSDGVYWFERVSPSDRPLLTAHTVEFLNAPGQVLLALPGLVAVDRVEMRAPPHNIGVFGRLGSLKRYRAFSWGAGRPRRPPESRDEELFRLESLDLPPKMKSSRLEDLAAEIAAGSDDELVCARAIEQFLRTRYGYTLNVEPLSSANPIERFLFAYKRGNCEVFAAAMVVLCRNLQIPARLVIGYHGGIRGDAPNQFVFRNQDAHAWVEVWSAEQGWATFDPTPPPPLEVYSGRFSFKKIMEWFQSATTRWDRFVVLYDNEAKARWMGSIWEPIDRWIGEASFGASTLERITLRLRENIVRPQVMALLAALVALNVAVAASYVRLKRRRTRGRPATLGGIWRLDPWHRFYRVVVDLLGGRLGSRLPAQTPGEFLETLARTRSLDLNAILPIVEFYHQGRFGRAAWDDQNARRADQLLSALAQSLGH